MTSFELLKFKKTYNSPKKSTFYIYIFILFPLEIYIMCDKLDHFMKKKIKYFESNYGMISGINIKLCKKSYRKEKMGGA